MRLLEVTCSFRGVTDCCRFRAGRVPRTRRPGDNDATDGGENHGDQGKGDPGRPEGEPSRHEQDDQSDQVCDDERDATEQFTESGHGLTCRQRFALLRLGFELGEAVPRPRGGCGADTEGREDPERAALSGDPVGVVGQCIAPGVVPLADRCQCSGRMAARPLLRVSRPPAAQRRRATRPDTVLQLVGGLRDAGSPSDRGV
ncbi:MAG: hypothetical protein CMP12_13525 [Zunongwangia sp.]|nr:hypothetical protein [Zunongwangia sp.]